MEEWKQYRLGDIISISSGLAYKGEHLGKGDSFLLGMGCVSYTEQFLEKGMRKYDGAYDERYSLKAGDIVLATRQQSDNLPILGMPAIIPQKFHNQKMVFGTNLYKVNLNSPDFSNSFLYWLLKTPNYIHHIKSCQTGTTVRMITKANIEDYTFFCPEKSEREKICKFLWNIENKIALNRRINDNLEQQAQLLFDNLIDASDWSMTQSLSELSEINPPRKLSKGENAPFIEMSNMPTSGSFPARIDFKEYNGGMKFRNGDTIMARITPCLENGKAAYVNFLQGNEIGFGSTEYIVLAPKKTISSSFLYFLVRNKEFVDYAVKHMNGSSGRQRVSGDTIGNYQLPILDRKKLSIFIAIADRTLTIIKQNSFEILNLVKQRDTLLPKLMSGELKINDLNC